MFSPEETQQLKEFITESPNYQLMKRFGQGLSDDILLRIKNDRELKWLDYIQGIDTLFFSLDSLITPRTEETIEIEPSLA